ncbi:MAG TPA: ATP-binding cassette domain-containing protein [Actinopolymorphaceae bacterium]
MEHVEVTGACYRLPDGRALPNDVSFRVGDGAKIAWSGANGCGRTTLLRIIAGDLSQSVGTVVRSGGLGIMRQFIGTGRGVDTVRDLLVSAAPPRIRAAAETPGGHLEGSSEGNTAWIHGGGFASLGANGTGKSHFLRLLAGWPVRLPDATVIRPDLPDAAPSH